MTDITTTQPLLTPLDLGDLRLPNRVVMAPITRARAANAELTPTAMHVAYYAQRASAGLIVTEGTWVGEDAVTFPKVPGIYRKEQVVAWRRVTEVVHALGGRIVLQLWHGAETAPADLSTTDVKAVIGAFATASANARKAGFDGVEVHAVGQFLLPRFLNPCLNTRTDGYRGGNLLSEVVEAATESWDGRRVGVRLSPYWSTTEGFVPDDETLAAYDEHVTGLNNHPLAYLHLRGEDSGPTPDAFARYRKQFNGPLIANMGFDQSSANTFIETGGVDAVSFATHYIANPDLVTRFALGRDLAAGDPNTYYQGGAEGYIDYPESR